jgi:hypothetical protein
MSKRTILEENYRPDVLFVRTSARVCVYPADAVKTASARTRQWVRTDAGLQLRGREIK